MTNDPLSHGNGKTKITIDMTELGPGWVYFQAGKHAPELSQLPGYLNQTMIDWLRDNQGYRVHAVLGVVADGATVGIHVWYGEANHDTAAGQ